MLRTTIPAATALAFFAVVEPAQAQTAAPGLGNAGQFIVSFDRLLGINVWSVKNQPDPTLVNMNPTPTKDSGTTINLLWGGSDLVGGNGGFVTPLVYSTPRLALDYVIIPGLTAGASLGYFHRGSSRESTQNNNVTVTVDHPSMKGFLIQPRVGYIFDFTPMLGVWARGGFTYFWVKTEETDTIGMVTGTTKISADGFALTLDPQLVVTPIPHVGFTVGPMFDIPLAGGGKTEVTGNGVTTTNESSNKFFNWGVSAGALVYF